VFDRYNDDWERLAWVLLRGRASLVTDAGEKAQAVAALRRKYPQYRTMALEERPLIRLEPERAASWGGSLGVGRLTETLALRFYKLQAAQKDR